MAFLSLSPGQEKIFSLLEQSAGTICEANLIVIEFLNNSACPEYKLRLLKSVKKRGDKLFTIIFLQTSRQFVLPLDAEDILALAQKLNLSVENLAQVMEKIIIFKLYPQKDESLMAMIDILNTLARDIYQLIAMLKNLRTKKSQIRKKCEEISLKKERSDTYCLQGIGDLLNQKNPEVINILKRREIYTSLELIINGFKDISNIIMEMTVKYV